MSDEDYLQYLSGDDLEDQGDEAARLALIRQKLDEWEDEEQKPEPVYDMAGFDPEKLLKGASLSALSDRIAQLEELIPDTEDHEQRQAFKQELAHALYARDSLGVHDELTDDELALAAEDAGIAVEAADLKVQQLLDAGYDQGSLTISRAKREYENLAQQHAVFTGEISHRDTMAMAERSYRNRATDRAIETWKAEVKAKLDASKQQELEPWERVKLQAELDMPVDRLPDYEGRLETAYQAIKSEATEFVMGRYQNQVEALYGDDIRAINGLSTATSAISDEATKVMSEIDAIRAERGGQRPPIIVEGSA